MNIFNGNTEAINIDSKIIELLKSRPELLERVLVIVQIGDNEASNKYIELKLAYCHKFGIQVEYLHFPADTKYTVITNQLDSMCAKCNVGGIIFQLPFPDMTYSPLLDYPQNKYDIDCLSRKAEESFVNKNFSRLSPTMLAANYFIEKAFGNLTLENKTALIVGEGKLVGKPLAKYLETKFNTVTIINDYIRGRKLEADLIILSAGLPQLVSGNDLQAGANVIDFGSSVVNGKTIGDLDYSTPLEHLNYLAKSPGGMGPLVIRFLIWNLINVKK